MLKVILILIALGISGSTFDGLRHEPDFLLLSHQSHLMSREPRLFLIHHEGLERSGNIKDLLQSPDRARYEPVENLLKFFYRGVVWFRIDILSESKERYKLILANQRPLSGVRLVDAHGTYKEFTVHDYSKYQTTYPFFEVDITPGLSSFYLRLDTSDQPATLVWKLWSHEVFAAENRDNLNDLVLIAIPAFLCLFQSIIFLVLGLFRSLFLVLGVSGFLGMFILLGGFYPLPLSQHYFELTRLVPLMLGVGVFGMNEYFRYFNGVSRKTTPLAALGMDGFSVIYIGLSLMCSINLSLMRPWMVFPPILGVAYLYYMTWIYRHTPWVQANKIYFFTTIPFAGSAIILALQMLGVLPYELRIIEFQFITISYLLLSKSMVMALATLREKVSNASIKNSILLGKSVQDLFIPLRLEIDEPDLHYQYRYIPFHGMMSGDWLQRWETPDGCRHFLIGDVVGKGPQAALAVGVVAMTVHQVARRGLGMETCIHEINGTLFRIFGGKLMTTTTGLTISKDHDLLVCHGGGVGCYHFHQGKYKHLIMPGPMLGDAATVKPPTQSVKLCDQDLIVAFTDGIAADQKSIRMILQGIANHKNYSNHRVEVMNRVVETTHLESTDDKAVLMIEKKVFLAA